MSTDDKELQEFLKERDQALRTLDMVWAEKMAREASVECGIPMPSREGMLGALHKARYLCKSIEPELRHESGRWLLQHMPNLARYTVHTDGTLPE